MNIGDKVKMIHDLQQGVVIREINAKTVEIEIEDGFIIPVLKRELVVITQNPNPIEKFDAARSSGSLVRNEPFSGSGIFMAFVPKNEALYSLNLVNNTDYHLQVMVGESRKGQFIGTISGSIPAKSFKEIGTCDIRQFENWPHWILQILFFIKGEFALKEPFVLRFKPAKDQFFKSSTKVPVMDLDGLVFQIDQMDKKNLEPGKIKEYILEPKSKTEIRNIAKAEDLIDLHFEKLVPDGKGHSNAEMLAIQISRFEQALDRAIASGLSEITFIHGVGAGVLKTEIHTRLSRDKRIKFYQDAQKEKFGYGATLVKF